MRKLLSIFCAAILLVSCDNTAKIDAGNIEVSILPQPKYLKMETGQVVLSTRSKLYSPDPAVYPLLELLSSDIKKITGVHLAVTLTNNHKADIVFTIDTLLQKDKYTIEVNKVTLVKGGSYIALAQAKSTLLQIIQKKEKSIMLPQVTIKDNPDAAYRGLMIDLARNWHDVSTIKKIIDFAAFYKINFLQLHFTDHQSYTLPSKKYPNLSTSQRYYSFEELEDLETYSQLRGVIIVPEIDVPGHSAQFTEKYPEIFALQNSKTNSSIINMGNEEAYEALDILIGEVLSVFKSTPYFHIGGDEAIFNGVMEDPAVQVYIDKHNIGTDVHDLFNHFIIRMNSIVKKYNKQMCVWEGFGPNSKVEIPKDIVVFPFETNRYLPNELINDGYTVVNVSWKPLYVVNEKKWDPKTIYSWNMWRWENWWNKAPSFKPIQIDKSDLVIGAQMCAWEQAQENEIPSLRKRLPAFMERVWNNAEKISYNELIKRMTFLDNRLTILIEDKNQDNRLFDYNFKNEK